MKTRVQTCLIALGCFSALHLQLSACFGQGTTFSYQGRLNENGTPFTGNAEFQVTLWDALSGGNPVATNNPAQLIVPVDNGLFTLPQDFGVSPFAAGAGRWAQLEVRTSIGSFSLLTPRQQLTPTPYAIFARGASGSGLTGALPPSALSGIYTNPLTLNNGGNSFSGTFIGDGSALANVNAAALGGVGVSNLWRTTGNGGTSTANFLGTTDNQPLDFRVGNVRGLRIEPDPRGIDAANLVAGHPSNRIEQPVSGGSVIAGGGAPLNQNIIRSNSSGAFIGAGSINVLGPNASDSVIAGGKANSAASYAVAVGGGLGNVLQTNADYSVIRGGNANLIQTNSSSSTIGDGAQNEIHGAAPFSTIAGGWFNKIPTSTRDANNFVNSKKVPQSNCQNNRGRMILTFSVLIYLCFGTAAAQYSMPWHPVDRGVGTSTDGVYHVTGTIGQPDAGGLLINGQHSVTDWFMAWGQAMQTPGAPTPRYRSRQSGFRHGFVDAWKWHNLGVTGNPGALTG